MNQLFRFFLLTAFVFSLGLPSVANATPAHIRAAMAAYNKALELRDKAEREQAEKKFGTYAKEELTELKKAIKSLLSKDSPLELKHQKLLYKMFARVLQLRGETPACMMCMRTGGKIAGSHYVSDSILSSICEHWVVPGSNCVYAASGMTLPLFCTDSKKNDLRCEQLMSNRGECKFDANFLPFIDAVVQATIKDAPADHALDYDSWLFHCITSLAFRVFISDLENPENWLSRIENKDKFKPVNESLWTFFTALREYVLGKTATPNHRIKLYLSEDGLRGRNELPLAHGIGSARAANWSHWVLFAIRGFHFLVLSDPNAENDLRTKLALPSRAFAADIAFGQGRLVLPQDRVNTIPQLVQGELQVVTQHVIDDQGTMNPQIVKQNLKKLNPTAPPANIDIEQLVEQTPPRYVVRLPDFLKFTHTKARKKWRSGKVSATRDGVVTLLQFMDDNRSQTACWVFKHRAGYEFAIVQIGMDKQDVVLGYEFDRTHFTPALLRKVARTYDFSLLSPALTHLRTTDHSDLIFGDPTVPAQIISRALIPSLIPNQSHGASSEEDEIRANRASIEHMNAVLLATGEEVPCSLRPSTPDGNCGYTSLDLTREDFIYDLMAAYQNVRNDPKLLPLILTALREDGAHNFEEWLQMLANRHHWMTFNHMRIASRLYNLRIFVYVVPAQNMLEPGDRGDVFVPLPDDQQHIIDETRGDRPVTEIHIAWTPMQAMTGRGDTPLNHFDRIVLDRRELLPVPPPPAALPARAVFPVLLSAALQNMMPGAMSN